jgi:hypothetical protein
MAVSESARRNFLLNFYHEYPDFPRKVALLMQMTKHLLTDSLLEFA